MGKLPKEMLQATDRLYARYGASYMKEAPADDPDVKIVLEWRSQLKKRPPENKKSPMTHKKFFDMHTDKRHKYLRSLKKVHPDWAVADICSWVGISSSEYYDELGAMRYSKYLIFTLDGKFVNGYPSLDEIGQLYGVGRKTKRLPAVTAELYRLGFILKKR